MPASRDRSYPCTLWTHSDAFSKELVLFNRSAVAQGVFPAGSLLSLIPLQHHAAPTAGQDHGSPPQEPFIFRANDIPQELKGKSNLQISVHERIAKQYGFSRRTSVMVSLADPQLHAASHVELSYRDVQLERSDMWRLCSLNLHGQALFQGQTVTFLGCVNLTVKSIYVRGHRVRSGVFTDSTRPVFRSETARYIVLIQMSKEMWDFDIQGSGEMLWSKCIDGFLPELFDRWASVNARHLLTVVLFTRLQYNRGRPDAHTKDFYRVVASEVPSTDSTVLLQRVRQDYVHFLRGVETQISADGNIDIVRGIPSTAAQGNFLEAINLATSHLSRESNDLDLLRTESSIIVVSPGVALMHADRDILRLTTERAISSGFAVDLVCLAQRPLHAVPLFMVRRRRPAGLAETTTVGASPSFPQSMTSLSVSPEISRMAMAQDQEPRLKMLDHTSWAFVRPSWVVTTFYTQNASTKKSSLVRRSVKSTYVPTCRMYQVQSMGVSQNGKYLTMPRIEIPFANEMPRNDASQMVENYDEDVFRRGLQVTPSSSAPRSRTATFTDDMDATPKTQDPRRQSNASVASSVYHSSSATPLLPRKRSPERSVSSQPVSQLRRDASPAPSVSSIGSKKSLAFLKFNSRLGKASVTTSATVESAEPARGHFRHESGEGKISHNHGSISRQFKMSLSRAASATAPSQITAPSKPIPIAPSPLLVPADKQKPAELEAANLTPKPWSLDRDDAFRAASLSKKQSDSLEHRYLSSKPSVTPREDMAPWLIDMKPADATPRNNDTFAGWKHVFVPTTTISAIKWTTLTCPASLPLTTECVPSVDVLKSSAYTESPYIVSLDNNGDQERAATILELVTRRISKGFQLAVGARASSLSGTMNADNNIFSPDFAKSQTASIVMVRGNTVHLLSADDNGVAVTRFQRRHTGRGSTGIKYEPKISTIMDNRYGNRVFQISTPQEENWNAIDNFIVGQQAPNPLTSSLGAATLSRVRFVLLPVEIPGPRKNIAFGNEDTDEELRLEGIRKLTMIWQGFKSFQREPQRTNVAGPSKAELSPLAIEYQTRDPSVVVTQGLENSPLVEGNQTVTSSIISGESEAYQTTKFDMHRLAADLQGPKGIKMRDRLWHLRIHSLCFEGVELTSFLLANFKDLENRDAAIDFGNVLMGKGLFEHVQLKHRFRDGHFFYSLAPEYRAHRIESRGWFSRRLEAVSPAMTAVDSRKVLSPSLAAVEDKNLRIPHSETGKPKVTLSTAITFDVDPGPRRRSNRPELIKLHYDRLHNPEAAFHILLEWENITAKLVEEHVSSWSIAVEKHGLKLIQVPLSEIGAIGRANPFRTPYIVKLAVAPPKNYIPRSADEPPVDLPPLPPTERFKHMKIILRKNGYVLDYEGSFRFPSTVDVKYSWGEAMYNKDQYIHKSGRALAQIVDDETLIVMVNRLSTSRNNPTKYEKDSARPGTAVQSRQGNSNFTEPVTSPRSRPAWSTIAEPSPASREVKGPLSPSLQQLKESIEAYCHNKEILLALYDELAPGHIPNTPNQRAVRTPSLDGSIPSLELPPIDDAEFLTLTETHTRLDTVMEATEPESRRDDVDPYLSTMGVQIPGK